MTPHDFCCWLTGYLIANSLGVDSNVRKEFEKVDLTVLPWYVPVEPPDPPQTPSSPPASPSYWELPNLPEGWREPYYWDSTVNCWQKLPAAHAQYYRDLVRVPN